MICNRCKVDKDITCFSNEARNTANGGKRYQCKSCDAENNKTWRKNLTDEQKTQLYATNRRYYENNKIAGRIIQLINGIKQRCRKNGKVSQVNRAFVSEKLNDGFCEATGLPFRYDESKRGGITPFSPSIDRRNSDGDYTLDNVQVVCSIYNIGKSHHDELDFIAMCIAVAQKNANNVAAIVRLIELRSK